MLSFSVIYKKIIANYISEYQPEKGEPSDEEVEEIIFSDDDALVKKIISYGQVSPENFWYDQDMTEYVYILEGMGKMEYISEDGIIKEIALSEGESCTIPSHLKHRVTYTSKKSPCVWLCVFYK